MTKIRIKSWEELEKIAIKKNDIGDLQMDGNVFPKEMSYLCNTIHMVDLSKSEIYISTWYITPEMYEIVEPSLLDFICEKLGIEVEDEWFGDDKIKYKFTKDGLLKWYNNRSNKWEYARGFRYRDIIMGKIKPVWKPKKGEEYYAPKINSEENERYILFYCQDERDSVDKFYTDNNMVFKTKEEAIECTDKMIKSIRGND